jgi:hypothetical protein
MTGEEALRELEATILLHNSSGSHVTSKDRLSSLLSSVRRDFANPSVLPAGSISKEDLLYLRDQFVRSVPAGSALSLTEGGEANRQHILLSLKDGEEFLIASREMSYDWKKQWWMARVFRFLYLSAQNLPLLLDEIERLEGIVSDMSLDGKDEIWMAGWKARDEEVRKMEARKAGRSGVEAGRWLSREREEG